MFVWLLSNNKRVAYARLRTRDLLYSSNREARGILCGKIVTLYLKVRTCIVHCSFNCCTTGRKKKTFCISACVCSHQGSDLQHCQSKPSWMCICGLELAQTPAICWMTCLQDTNQPQGAPTATALLLTCFAWVRKKHLYVHSWQYVNRLTRIYSS